MNKDYKRLTARNEKGEWVIELNEELKMVQHNLSANEFIKVLFNLTALRLCDLEDKIENGTLIELPCKDERANVIAEEFEELIRKQTAREILKWLDEPFTDKEIRNLIAKNFGIELE